METPALRPGAAARGPAAADPAGPAARELAQGHRPAAGLRRTRPCLGAEHQRHGIGPRAPPPARRGDRAAAATGTGAGDRRARWRRVHRAGIRGGAARAAHARAAALRRVARAPHRPATRVRRGRGWGAAGTDTPSEGSVARRVLRDEYGLHPRWSDRSRDSAENAARMTPLLRADHVRQIALVTDAAHMERAAADFRSKGFEVLQAPINFPTRIEQQVLEWLPSVHGKTNGPAPAEADRLIPAASGYGSDRIHRPLHRFM